MPKKAKLQAGGNGFSLENSKFVPLLLLQLAGSPPPCSAAAAQPWCIAPEQTAQVCTRRRWTEEKHEAGGHVSSVCHATWDSGGDVPNSFFMQTNKTWF